MCESMLIDSFAELEDKRSDRNTLYPIEEIVLRPFCSKRTKMGAKQAIHPFRSGLSPVRPASRSTSKRYRP